jgi:hypothetical protein
VKLVKRGNPRFHEVVGSPMPAWFANAYDERDEMIEFLPFERF